MPSLAGLTIDDFIPCRGQSFRLRAPAGEAELELAEIRPLGRAVRPGGAFSLLFLAPSGPFLPQATYLIAHPTLGDLELFIVPVGAQDGRNAYEAIFT